MSITDELRGFANSGMSAMECYAYSDKLIDIADRIDAAVEGMVELPKDADDVPWNVGDRDEDGNVVTELRLTYDGCWFVITDGEWPYRPKRKRHHHVPDTWERIIEDARAYSMNISGSYLWKNKSDELVARCKTLAGDADE